MALTWSLANTRERKGINAQLRLGVWLGILYGVVDAIPVSAWKHDVPCSCETEECLGSSLPCIINRSSVYILLAIMTNLALLTFDLYRVVKDPNAKRQTKTLDWLALLIPFVLMVVGYAVDTDDPEVENALLNTIRQGFKCNIRFSNMFVEWGLLWFHFVWSGVVIVFCTLSSAHEIASLQKSVKNPPKNQNRSSSSKKVGATMHRQRQRLFQIALQTCFCLMLNLCTTVGISASLDEWGRSSNLWLDCSLYDSWRTRDWDAYGFTNEQKICRKDDSVGHHGYGYSPNVTECVSDCFYSSTELFNGIQVYCDLRDGEYLSIYGEYQYLGCECSCEDMVEVKKPSVVVMALSFLGQSLVASIIGLNMLLR